MPRTPKPVSATWTVLDEPNWEPLLHHVGPLLARWFMATASARLADGSHVHAYKHVLTRRYLHIHDDGRCFAYLNDRTLQEVPRRASVVRVFGDHGHYPSDEVEFDAYEGAIEAAWFLAWWRDEDERREHRGEPPFQPSIHRRAAARDQGEGAEVLPFRRGDHDPSEDAA